MTNTRVLADPEPVVWVANLGDSSVDYVLRFWISDPSDGLTNIKGRDGLVARHAHVGSAYVTGGADVPLVGTVMTNTVPKGAQRVPGEN